MMWKVVSMRCEFTLMLDCLVVITNWIICSFGFLWIHGLQLLFIAILDCHKIFLFIFSGIEWILDNDASNAAVLVASEAHAITVAVEGLLGVIFTVATLTDEAVDVGEVILWCFFLYTFLIVYYKKKKKKKRGLTLSLYNQLDSPRYEYDPVERYNGKTTVLCIAMVDSFWLTILDALSLILSRFVKFFFVKEDTFRMN